MKAIYIAKRVLKDEKGVLFFLALLFLIPTVFSVMARGRFIENVAVLLMGVPFLLYPFFFFVRGILITRKEWDRGTVYIYKTNSISAFEYEFGYMLYATMEILFLTVFPIVLIYYMSHAFRTIIVFTPSWGTFFVFFPLFSLSYLFGRFLFLLSRSIYRNRNTVAFFIGLFAVVIFFKVYAVFLNSIPAPFKLRFITNSEHVFQIGSFTFVYSLLWFVPVFVLNVYMWSNAEG